MMFSKKRIIIIGAAIVMIMLVIAIVIMVNQPSNAPVVSKVPEGETVNPSDNGSTSNSGNNNGNANGGNNGSSSSNTGNGSSSNGGGSQATPTNAQLSEVIQQSASYLTNSNGQATFGITKVVSPLAGWYVASIDIAGGGQPMKVILLQTNNPNNPLTVVAGPGTAFPPDVVTLPDAVRRATL